MTFSVNLVNAMLTCRPTSVNWQLMSLACCSISTAIATAYDSLGESGLQHSLNEPGCVAIFTNAELLPVPSAARTNILTGSLPTSFLLNSNIGIRWSAP